jgi:hypothetical protein
MSFYSYSRSDLIEMMLKVPLRAWMGGTVDSGTTSTLVDDELEQPDDYFQNTTPVSRVRIVSTTDGLAPKGEERRITDFANSTGTITISTDKVFSVTPTAGDKYVILCEYDWAELAAAINLVIDSMAEKALVYKVDETLEAVEGLYEYTLPPGFVTIHRVTQANDDGTFTDPVPGDHYTVIKREPATLKLLTMPIESQYEGHYWGDLWAGSSLVDGRKFRIEGYARQPRLETDDDICQLNPNYIILKAAAMTLASRVTATDYDAYKIRSVEIEKQAEAYAKDLIVTQFPANTKWLVR